MLYSQVFLIRTEIAGQLEKRRGGRHFPLFQCKLRSEMVSVSQIIASQCPFEYMLPTWNKPLRKIVVHLGGEESNIFLGKSLRKYEGSGLVGIDLILQAVE